MKKLFALLICVAMILGLTACGGAESTSNVDSPSTTTVAANVSSTEAASAEVTTEVQETETVAEAIKGDPLTEDLLGVWVMITDGSPESFIYVSADGVWGMIDDPEDIESMEEYGAAACVGGKLTLYGADEPFSFTKDNDTLNCDNEERLTLVRLQSLFPSASSMPVNRIGYWKYEDREIWLVIGSDATWYSVDANNEKLDGGYVYGEEGVEEFALIPEGYESIYIGMGDDEENILIDYTAGYVKLNRVDALPDGSSSEDLSMTNYYVGLWQTVQNVDDRDRPCVYIEQDGSYKTLNKENEILAEGQIVPGENRQVAINADGTGEVMWTLMEDGAMYDGAETALVRLSDNGAPAEMMELVGSYANWDEDKILVVREDATWFVLDKYGNQVETGVVSADPVDNMGEGAVLISDEKTYPLITNDDQMENDSEIGLILIPNDEFPEMMAYVGLWYFEAKDATIKLTPSGYYEHTGLILGGIDVDEEGNQIGEFEYLLYVNLESGVMMLEGDGEFNGYQGFRYEVQVDEDGCLCNKDGKKLLYPVSE